MPGSRVEIRVTQSELLAVALDTGGLVTRHQRSFVKHPTITVLEHADVLRELRGARAEPEVELRPAAWAEHQLRCLGIQWDVDDLVNDE
jgi:hypothetical protein